MPNRINVVWGFERGYYIGDPISKNQNIKVISDFEVEIFKNKKVAAFYLVGCYFGNLFLLEKKSLKFTVYTKF